MDTIATQKYPILAEFIHAFSICERDRRAANALKNERQ